MAVTLQGATGVETITAGQADVLGLAANIGSVLQAAHDGGTLEYHTASTGGSSLGTAPVTPGHRSALEITGSTSFGGTIAGGVNNVIVTATAPVSLTGSNVALVAGTAGGSFNVSGNSTVVAAGRNNTISASGTYLVSLSKDGDCVNAGYGSGTIATGSGNATVVANGNDSVSSRGQGDLVLVSSGSSSVNASGDGFGLLGHDGSTIIATISGAAATVSASNSDMDVAATGDNGVVFGSSDRASALRITTSGSSNTIVTSASNASVDAAGANSLIVGGNGALNVNLMGHDNGIITGTGPSTINALGSSADSGGVVLNRSGTLNFVGGAGTATVVGDTATQYVTVGSGGIVVSTGTNSVTDIQSSSLSGGSTVFGGAGSVVSLVGATSGTQAGAIMVASNGNETLDASQSKGDNVFAGSNDKSSNILMVGGSGKNTFFAGAGNATMTGGAGTDVFAFFAMSTHGQTNYIQNFDANDSIDIIGYAADKSASSLQRNAAVVNGSVTLTLSDNTRIVFTNIANASQLNGKIFYG